MHDNLAGTVIVSAIGFAVTAICTLFTAFVQDSPWSFLFAGLCVGYAIVFAIHMTDLRNERRKVSRQYVPRAPDFPEQRKHDIR